MGSLNPAAAGSGGGGAAVSSTGDWRPQFKQEARKVFVSMMLQTLRRHLPVEDAWRRNIATQIEKQCYIASTNQSKYLKNIAAVMLHVEKRYQNHRHPASSLSSDGQSSTGDSQTSGLHNTSGQSTIGQMPRMAIQSATQSGIRHNSFNTVQQPMNQQQQYPEPSMNQQFSVQQIERSQQSLQQLASGELSNLYPNQPNNLLNQHQTQEFILSEPQFQDFGALCDNEETFDILTFFNAEIHDDTATNFGVGDQEIPGRETNIDGCADIQPPPVSETQMKNTGDEEDGCFDSTGLTAKEDPDSVFVTDMPTNLKKRKYNAEIHDDTATNFGVMDQEISGRETNIDGCADIQPPPVGDTQMKNTGDEEDGCFDSTGLTAKEDPNCVFMTDMPAYLNMASFLAPVDDYSSVCVSPSSAYPWGLEQFHPGM